jgi:integrase
MGSPASPTKRSMYPPGRPTPPRGGGDLRGPFRPCGQSRVVDLDSGTVAAPRAYRAARGLLALDLERDSSRRFAGQVVQARKALGEDLLLVIRLHDLRHTHPTPLLADGVPVKVVSERFDPASATITLTVYRHVHPGMGRKVPNRYAARLEGSSEV